MILLLILSLLYTDHLSFKIESTNTTYLYPTLILYGIPTSPGVTKDPEGRNIVVYEVWHEIFDFRFF